MGTISRSFQNYFLACKRIINMFSGILLFGGNSSHIQGRSHLDNLQLRKCVATLGLARRDQLMDSGEMRFRFTSEDNTGFICCVSPPSGVWEDAHYHESLLEITVVQNGFAAYVTSEDKKYTVTIYKAGEYFKAEPNVSHNIYLYPDTVTYTVKYGKSVGADWHGNEYLDKCCKKLDKCYMETLRKKRVFMDKGLF